MLELGNEAQVREALEGKSGFEKEVEDELIRRVAIAELLGVILSIISFIVM